MKLSKFLIIPVICFLFQQVNAQSTKDITIDMIYKGGFRPFPRSNSIITLENDLSKFKSY